MTSRKVLIIDDDEEFCDELSEILTKEGCSVQCVFDGLTGLKRLTRFRYHIVILDLKLPGMDGYAILQSIDRTKRPEKFIVLSGRPMKAALSNGVCLKPNDGVCLKKKAEELCLQKADVIMNKPFAIDALLEKIRLYLPVADEAAQ